jgi:NADP-dependent 3-hydroxy acid dehydrogenase YdfG
VALAARRESALLEVRAGLDHWGGEARSMVAATDVADRDQDKSLVACTEEELEPADVLVNCAGVMYYTLVYTLGTQHPTLRFRALLTNDAQEVRFEWVSGDRVLRD